MQNIFILQIITSSFDTQDSLAFGVDIETGGHVFQLIVSNSITMIEKKLYHRNYREFL